MLIFWLAFRRRCANLPTYFPNKDDGHAAENSMKNRSRKTAPSASTKRSPATPPRRWSSATFRRMAMATWTNSRSKLIKSAGHTTRGRKKEAETSVSFFFLASWPDSGFLWLPLANWLDRFLCGELTDGCEEAR